MGPFYDMRWWSRFLSGDEVLQGELLTTAVCGLLGLKYERYEDIARLLMECKLLGVSTSGYCGGFDRRYLYPLYVSYDITLTQTSSRLELYAVDRLKTFQDKTLVITRADASVDWVVEYTSVVKDIDSRYPHINGWHQALDLYMTYEPE